MYLHTRLLLGIAAVMLAALLLSVLIPLGSVRTDADRLFSLHLLHAGD